MRSRSRSRERRTYRRRSRSRSPDRPRRTKERYHKRDRTRSRSRSQSEVEKLLKREREKAKQDRNKSGIDSSPFIADGSAPSTSATTATTASMLTLDPASNKELVKVIKERVDQEVRLRHEELEVEIQRRLTATRQEMEVGIRCQVEMQLRDEMVACQKRENDAKQKCEALDRELRIKMDMLEESRRKVEEERLEMLEMKRKLDEERNSLRKEREKVNRNEQTVILGKGNARPKLRFSLAAPASTK